MAGGLFFPDNDLTAEDHFNQGLDCYYRHDYGRAITCYSRAIRLAPQNPNVYYNRGHARRHDGDLGGAIEDYTAAIRLAPHAIDIYYERAIAHTQNGDLHEAIADYRRYLEACDDDLCDQARDDIEQAIHELHGQLGHA
ncbi:MAG: tetratricopeptide repeat protein [Anaerolineae bacterium]|nr:tetratricopeptide repeat protein [Anaerolineae bacterium]